MAAWMQEVERRGALLIGEVGVPELEKLTADNDLVILAADKGDVVRLFERDAARSAFDRPMRTLALTYVKGLAPAPEFSRVAFNLIPGVGEYFTFPSLTTSGPCDIMVFEGLPGGPMDCWADVKTPQQHLAQSKRILDKYLPWEAARARHLELTDPKGILVGNVVPTVRKPVLTLSSGKLVLGLGDALVVQDPITGQGSNSAAKASRIYLDAIVHRGNLPFNREWMEQTFEQYWDYARWVVSWTNSLLCPPPPHILNLLAAAGQCPPLASIIANGFDHPPALFPWWQDAQACDALVSSTLSTITMT
jgi:hypothetical protein